MPRYGVSFNEQNLYSTPELVSSQRNHRDSNEVAGFGTLASPSSSSSKEDGKTKSVRLACVSPEGKQWYSLLRKEGKYVVIYRLFEEVGDVVQQSPRKVPPILEVVLPEMVQKSLHLDPPMELFFAEAEGTELNRLRLRPNDRRIGLPRLCIYSSSSLFLIQSAFDPRKAAAAHGSGEEDTAFRGEVVSAVEPFDEFLLKYGCSTRILRARPAPQRWMGHALHSPGGCLTVLTEDRHNCEYRLVSLESDGKIKQPTFDFAMEQISGGMNRIVDFCFAQSTGLALLSSLAILLVKADGDVLAASPFVFNGTMAPRVKLDETMEFLNVELARLDRSQPKWRQYRAAQQFLTDVFPRTDRKTQFVAARTLTRNHGENASGWPLRLQGPILFRNEQQEEVTPPGLSYSTIENFGKADLLGFAIGMPDGRVDIGVTSPTTIIPRFAFESRNDTFALDDLIFQSSAWVEKVALDLGKSEPTSFSMHQDPNFDSILHVVSGNFVASIYSNCVRCACSRVKENQNSISISTDAWSYLEYISQRNNVQGILCCSDTVSGNQLLIQFSDGAFQTVSVDEKKASRDLQIVRAKGGITSPLRLEAPKDPKYNYTGKISSDLDSSAPFHETAALQIQKVNKGLASMSRVVGSETRYDEVTPDMLAVVASIQERCENEVVLPVLELARMVKNRREAVLRLLQNQKNQVMELMKLREKVEERNQRLREMLNVAEANGRNLKDRLNAAYEASKDFEPAVTKAESEFFHFVRSMDVKVGGWEENIDKLRAVIRDRCKTMERETIPDNLLLSYMEDLQKISMDSGKKLVGTRQTLQETNNKLRAVLRSEGLETSSDSGSFKSGLNETEKGAGSD